MPEHAALQVHRLDSRDEVTGARWDAFVLACPQATFFHRAGWQRVLRQVFGHDTHFLYAEEKGVITGVLPLGHVNSRLFGHSLTSLPFAVYGGVAARTEASATALEAEAQRLAQQLGTDHLELRNLKRRHRDWPLQDLYVTFRKPLLPTEAENLHAIPRRQRAMVRKGLKNGLLAQIDSRIDRFFDVYADNVHRHGTPALPKRYFQALMDTFGADCEVLTVCTPQGQVVSSVLSFYFRDEVLPYYAGDLQAARALAANDFKYWELMRRACARGLKTFDFGRSKAGTGPYAFKKNWGFEPTPLFYEYRLYKRAAIPQHNPANTKYQLLIKAWQHLPLSLANRLGPFIVRHLG